MDTKEKKRTAPASSRGKTQAVKRKKPAAATGKKPAAASAAAPTTQKAAAPAASTALTDDQKAQLKQQQDYHAHPEKMTFDQLIDVTDL